MERVISINLNGHAYTLDESAYARLKKYMDEAGAALSDNPDREEILRDLEQAIAEKCAPSLNARKSVISDSDIEKALAEMGPVEGQANPTEGAAEPDGASQQPKKRLYRIRDGAVISGVCSGIGAYFDLDPNIVRILFIVSGLFSGGATLLLYVAMMFLIPSANTREEWAQAHGLAFNAQEVIDRAKQEYARFANEPQWGGRMRRKWRRRYREWRQAASWGHEQETVPSRRPVSYGVRVASGALVVLFSIIGAALTIAFLASLLSLLTTGMVLNWAPPASVPVWFAVLVLLILFAIISSPITAVRRWAYITMNGYPSNTRAWVDRSHNGFGFVFAVVMIIAIAHWTWPESRMAIEAIPQMTRDLWESITEAFRQVQAGFAIINT